MPDGKKKVRRESSLLNYPSPPQVRPRCGLGPGPFADWLGVPSPLAGEG